MKLNNKVDTIQVLRGIASLLVLFCHLDLYIDEIIPGSKSLFNNGVVGVDIFFIISGFVIYVSYKGDSSAEFFIKRFFRVYIPAAVAIAITVVVAGIPIIGNIDVYKSMMFIPMSNDNAPFYGYNLLAVVWTLTYEMYFYFLFCLAILASRKSKFIGVISSLLIVFSVFGGQYILNAEINLNAMTYVYTGDANLIPKQLISLTGNPIILEFIIGIFLGYVFKNHRDKLNMSKGKMNSLISILVAVFMFRFFGSNFDHGILDGGIFSLCVVVAALLWHRGIELGFYKTPKDIFLYFGTISFSLYLMHVPVYIGLMEPNKDWFRHGGMFMSGLVAVFVSSALFYHFVEMNAQRAGKYLSKKI